MAYTLRESISYRDDVDQLPMTVRCQLLPKAHRMLESDPLHKGLESERIKSLPSSRIKAFRSRVDGTYRIAWTYADDQTIVLWHVDKHQVIDAIDCSTPLPRPVSETPADEPTTARLGNRETIVPKAPTPIFVSFPDTHLRLLGVPAERIPVVRRVTDRNSLWDLGLPNYCATILADICTKQEWSIDSAFDSRQVFFRANADELAEYCLGHTRELLLDLAPEQEKLVHMRTSGPTLIKGVAGSGKTTVGVYRAMNEARSEGASVAKRILLRAIGRDVSSPRRVLFLTYSVTLAKAVHAMFRELFGSRADLVETASLHGWARRFLTERLGREVVTPGQEEREQLVKEAMRKVRDLPEFRDGEKMDFKFCLSEIEQVVKGRRLANWETYREANRVGRGAPLKQASRRFVWAVHEEYGRCLASLGAADHADLCQQRDSRVGGVA
jgi:hypothetical protein